MRFKSSDSKQVCMKRFPLIFLGRTICVDFYGRTMLVYFFLIFSYVRKSFGCNILLVFI